METITLELDDLDHATIVETIALRKNLAVLPDGDGNLEGRILAEICRGWQEFLRFRTKDGELIRKTYAPEQGQE